MIGIVGCDGRGLGYVAAVAIGLRDFQSDAAGLARGDRFIVVAGCASTRWGDVFDLEGFFTVVLDLKRELERRARLHRAERVFEGRSYHPWRAN